MIFHFFSGKCNSFGHLIFYRFILGYVTSKLLKMSQFLYVRVSHDLDSAMREIDALLYRAIALDVMV